MAKEGDSRVKTVIDVVAKVVGAIGVVVAVFFGVTGWLDAQEAQTTSEEAQTIAREALELQRRQAKG